MGQFLLFHPLNSPKNENLKKVKKMPRGIIILHKCTKDHDHMLCCFWDMAHDGCNCYFSFWAIFCFFTPVAARKIKISKKWKKNKTTQNAWRYYHFTHVAKFMNRWCTLPDIWCETEVRTDGRTEKVT